MVEKLSEYGSFNFLSCVCLLDSNDGSKGKEDDADHPHDFLWKK